MNTPQISRRAGKRRIATRFALAGALSAAPIALITSTAHASYHCYSSRQRRRTDAPTRPDSYRTRTGAGSHHDGNDLHVHRVMTTKAQSASLASKSRAVSAVLGSHSTS